MAATCSVDDCARPHRARGLCSTHYSQAHQPGHHSARVTVECAGCGASVEKRPDPRRPRRYCSLKCRTDTQYREVRAARPGTALVHAGPSWPRTDLHPKHPARTGVTFARPRRFISGPCAWCGEQFTIIDQTEARYCSRICQRVAGKRKGRFKIPRIVRLAIYERDGWICQLCFGPVDPSLSPSDEWAATLDHILCQSWTDEPDHSPSNLRLAHRWCNSVRGSEQYYTAADLAA